MDINNFLQKAQEHAERENERRYYTYTLENSLTGLVFYVGKGTGLRMYRHEDEAKRECECQKCKVIRGIWNGDGSIVKRKVNEHLTSQEAFDEEAQLILLYGFANLTNVAPQSTVPREESVIPVNICLYKSFRNEIEALLIARMEQEGIEISRETCYQYLQDICLSAIRDHL